MKKTTQLVTRSSGCTQAAVAQPALQEFVMKCCVFLAVLLMTVAPASFGQALPAAEASPISTGFELPTAAGTLNYAVSAGETLSWGYYTGASMVESTNLSGDLGYISNSKRDPTSAVLAGGYSWGSENLSYGFMSLGLSQVISAGRWSMVLSDSLSYMPGTTTVGLTGIAGVGDLGVTPVQVGPPTGQGILTQFSNRIANTASLSISHPITGKTSFDASGSYSINRFLTTTSGSATNAGLDSDSENGGGGISHQFNTRTSLAGNYAYSAFSFPGNNLGLSVESFNSQTASLEVSHRFTRKLNVNASAGPQWTTVNGVTSLSAYADVGLSYAAKFTTMSLTFVRTTNVGSGVIGGAIADSVLFSAQRTFDRVWNCAFTSSYTHSSSLTGALSFDSTLAGAQVSRAFAHSLSGYASYTLENQSSQGPTSTAVDVFNGFSQVLGFGLTYAPMSMHFGH